MVRLPIMAKLFFVGIKHSGKTTQARLVSSILSLPFCDADDLIKEGLNGESVRDVYKREGKEAFMERERNAVHEYIMAHDAFILSLGGGASDNTSLMEEMKKNGKIIYLKRKEEEMLPVILKHGIPAFLDENDLEGSFHKLYERRNRIYEEYADLVIDLGSYGDKAKTAERTAKALKEAFNV